MGTRPELIKLAPLISLCKNKPEIKVWVCSTTQHLELINENRDYFNIDFDFELNLIRENQSLTTLHVRIMEELDKVYKVLKPDCIIVQGDTTTSFAAAITAYYNKIDVAHVEAGLRTYDMLAPYPEEGNRRLISVLAAIHFAPTNHARDNLCLEGVAKEKIYVTGDTGIDALMQVKKYIEGCETPAEILSIPQYWQTKNRRMILVTCHRRESLDGGLENICLGIKESANQFSNSDFLLPMHPNPIIRRVLKEQFKNIDNVYLLDSLAYPVFVYLMLNAYFIITDSAGIQEELSVLGKPVIIVRDKTERVEILQRHALLVGFNFNEIKRAVYSLMNDEDLYKRLSFQERLYGDGHASEIIWGHLKNFLS